MFIEHKLQNAVDQIRQLRTRKPAPAPRGLTTACSWRACGRLGRRCVSASVWPLWRSSIVRVAGWARSRS